MNTTPIGPMLRWARRPAGMTQQDLAEAAGMPQSSVARIEAGAVSPRSSTLIKLLAATGHRLALESVGEANDVADEYPRLTASPD